MRVWKIRGKIYTEGCHIVAHDECDYNALSAINALQHCEIRDGRVLIIGCNTGLDCSYFLQAGAKEIHGVDVLDEIGRDLRHENVQYHKRSAENMACFSDDTFDLVYAIATLEHIPDIDAVFREMYRVCRQGGTIFSLSAPLWHSRFGHHKADLFMDYPWIHLLLSHDQIIDWFIRHKAQEMASMTTEIKYHVEYMLNKNFFNMRPARDYITACESLGAEIVCNQIEYESEELLTSEAKNRLLGVYDMEELLGVTHRFIARK